MYATDSESLCNTSLSRSNARSGETMKRGRKYVSIYRKHSRSAWRFRWCPATNERFRGYAGTGCNCSHNRGYSYVKVSCVIVQKHRRKEKRTGGRWTLLWLGANRVIGRWFSGTVDYPLVPPDRRDGGPIRGTRDRRERRVSRVRRKILKRLFLLRGDWK